MYATNLEEELSNQYKRLDLSNEQRKMIEKWVDAIHAQDEAYTVVVFRMAVQYCFAMLLELADLKQQVSHNEKSSKNHDDYPCWIF